MGFVYDCPESELLERPDTTVIKFEVESNPGYTPEFYGRVWKHIKHILQRDNAEFDFLLMDEPESIGGEQFRFVQLWVEGERSPHTWNTSSNGIVHAWMTPTWVS